MKRARELAIVAIPEHLVELARSARWRVLKQAIMMRREFQLADTAWMDTLMRKGVFPGGAHEVCAKSRRQPGKQAGKSGQEPSTVQA
jgi:hypothetical protein